MIMYYFPFAERFLPMYCFCYECAVTEHTPKISRFQFSTKSVPLHLVQETDKRFFVFFKLTADESKLIIAISTWLSAL
jgi:hypothetical protein